MDAKPLFRHARAIRERTLALLDGLDRDQLLAVPEGSGNNLLWNAGHITYVQDALCYAAGGLPSPAPEEYKACFARGTSPHDWTDPPDSAGVYDALKHQADRIADDHLGGVFSGYGHFKLREGIEFHNFEEAFTFSWFHEGIHLGIMMRLRRTVG